MHHPLVPLYVRGWPPVMTAIIIITQYLPYFNNIWQHFYCIIIVSSFKINYLPWIYIIWWSNTIFLCHFFIFCTVTQFLFTNIPKCISFFNSIVFGCLFACSISFIWNTGTLPILLYLYIARWCAITSILFEWGWYTYVNAILFSVFINGITFQCIVWLFIFFCTILIHYIPSIICSNNIKQKEVIRHFNFSKKFK